MARLKQPSNRPTQAGFPCDSVSACFLLVLAALALAAGSGGGPGHLRRTHELRFRRHEPAGDRTTTVTVTNKGAGLLRIQDVKADCGCTVPTLAKKHPGARGVDRDRDQVQQQEIQRQGLSRPSNIISNDPHQPRGRRHDQVPTVYTPLIDRSGQPARRLFPVPAGRDDQPNTSPSRPRSHPSWRSPPTRPARACSRSRPSTTVEGDPRSSILEVTVPADMAPGRHRDNVRVADQHRGHAHVDIEMQAWVVAGADRQSRTGQFPLQEELSSRPSGSPPSRRGLEFKVTGAEIDLPEISVEVMETIPNAETKVILEGKPISKDRPPGPGCQGPDQGHPDHPHRPGRIPGPSRSRSAYMVRM